MSRSKKWMIAGLILLATGALICVISLAALGFDLKKLSTVKCVTKTYEIGDGFQNIIIGADIEKTAFAPSDDGKCRVVCYEEEKDPHNVRITGDTLTIDKEKKWEM